LGAGDYLALAKAVRVLILTGCPPARGHQFSNEAKAFCDADRCVYEGG